MTRAMIEAALLKNLTSILSEPQLLLGLSWLIMLKSSVDVVGRKYIDGKTQFDNKNQI